MERMLAMLRRWVALVILVAIGLSTASCGHDDAGGGDLSVSRAWARTSPGMASAGAAYLEQESASADRLVSASVDPSVAAMVEIHEVVPVETGEVDGNDTSEDAAMADDGEMSDDEGMSDTPMTMRELAGGLDLPAGEPVILAPGGYHLMLLDLAEPLELGSSFDLTLDFEIAGTRTVAVELRDDAP